jgi:hypothetical protein
VTGKVLSLFAHPEFVERYQEWEQRKLAQQVVPVIQLDSGRLRCRRCSHEFDGPTEPAAPGAPPMTEECPQCEPRVEVDALEAFLHEVLRDGD